MSEIAESLVRFLAILNPFAFCPYLVGVMEDLGRRDFIRVLGGACVTALAVFSIFALVGKYVLVRLLGVRVEALRIFGGIIDRDQETVRCRRQDRDLGPPR